MSWYTYESQIALDQSTEQVARNAAGHVYAKTDTAFATPLTVTDLAGVNRTEIIANGLGFIEEFRVEDHKVVVWKSGDFKTVIASISGIIEDAEAARASADQAYADLQEYIAANPGTLPGGRQPGQILGVGNEGELLWVEPTVGGGSGILGAPAAWPQESPWPAPQHSHPVAELRRVGTTPLAAAVASLLAATDQAAARAAIGAGTGNGTSNLQLGTLSTDAMSATKTFKSDEIALFAAVSGLSATTVHAALAELAARPSSSGAGRVDYRYYVAGAWQVRGTVAAGTLIFWIGPVWPPIGGLYLVAGLDIYLATP